MQVEKVAKIISGAPFPSKQSLAKARKVVESLELGSAPQWQPIETAESATPVLTIGPDGVKVAYRYDGRWLSEIGDELWVVEPTHWHPLPAAPEVP